MSLIDLFGDSATISNGTLSISITELDAKAQAYKDSLGAAGTWIGITSTNQEDPEVLAVAFMMAFSNFLNAERLVDDPTADVSCSLSGRSVSLPPFGEEATGLVTLSNEFTLIQANIPLELPVLDPNASFG